MQPKIAALTFEAEDHVVVKGVLDLDEKGYIASKHAISEVNRFEAGQLLFQICTDNYQDLSNIIEEVVLGQKKGDFDDALIIRQANRRIMNFLSSFKSFLDHWNKKLEHIHQERSINLVTEYKQLTAYHYDNYFSYRFLSRLRNYVQHYALPIQGFRIHLYEEDDQKKLFVGIVTPILVSSTFSWPPYLKKEIAQLPYVTNIMPMLEELMSSISNINTWLTATDLNLVRNHWELLVEQFVEVQKAVPDSLPIVTRDITAMPFNFTLFPINGLKLIQNIIHS